MKIIRGIQVATLLAATGIAYVATATQDNRFPTGKYCGKLLSNGIMVEAETTFDPSVTDGRITGSYMFFEAGRAVTGLLAEPNDDGDSNVLTRNLVWQDRYGNGKLIITFLSDFSEFRGNWGDGEKVSFPWYGRRCELAIS